MVINSISSSLFLHRALVVGEAESSNPLNHALVFLVTTFYPEAIRWSPATGQLINIYKILITLEISRVLGAVYKEQGTETKYLFFIINS